MDRKFKKEEEKLAKKLKKFCYENGKEKCLEEVGKILLKMGTLYYDRSANNQVLYSKCCVLYNAAMLRYPAISNEVNRNMTRLYTSLARKIGGNGKCSDLVRLSAQCKDKVAKFREQTMRMLSEIPRIPDDIKGADVFSLEEKKIVKVQEVQRSVTHNYISIIYDIAESCLKLMGKPPCLFSVVCFGAIAREDVTPYSQYEVGVVLPKSLHHKSDFNKIFDFFHWFLSLFHITFVNLGETELKQGAINSVESLSTLHNPCVFDSTPAGISFEGLLSKPLILSPDMPILEMLKLFDIPKNLSKVVHRHYISDRLTKCCFVYGDTNTYNAYHVSIGDQIRQKTADLSQSDYAKLIKVSLGKVGFLRYLGNHVLEELDFEPRYAIHRGTQILVYALARLRSIKSSSYFDVVSELFDSGHISSKYAHQLHYMVAIACEVRLKLSVLNKCRVPHSLQNDLSDAEVKQIVDTVGRTSLIEFFWIAWSLYVDVKNEMKSNEQLKLDMNSTHFTRFGFLVYSKTCYHLRLYDTCIEHCTLQLRRKTNESHWNAYRQLICACYERQGKCQSAINHYEKLIKVLDDEADDGNRAEIAFLLSRVGRCALILNSPVDAMTSLTRAETIYDNIQSTSISPETIRAACYNQSMECIIGLAECYINSDRAGEVMTLFKHNQFGYQELPIKNYRYNVRIRLIVGRCLQVMKSRKLAISELQDALDLARKCAIDIDTDPLVAEVTDALGCCLLNSGRPKEAWVHFQYNLDVDTRIPFNFPYLRHVHASQWLSNIGQCLRESKRYEEALHYLRLAINIRRSAPKELNLAPLIAIDLDRTASIYSKQNKELDAFQALSEVCDMQGTLNRDTPFDFVTPKAVHDMGLLLKTLDRWDEAKEHFEKERSLLSAMPSRCLPGDKPVGRCFFKLLAKAKERGTEIVIDNFIDKVSLVKKREMLGENSVQMGSCAKQHFKFNEAMLYFKKALKFYGKSSPYLLRRNVGSVKHGISGLGECLMKTSRFVEAIPLLIRALELSREITENPGNDSEVLSLQEGLKLCRESLGENCQYPSFTPLVCHLLND